MGEGEREKEGKLKRARRRRKLKAFERSRVHLLNKIHLNAGGGSCTPRENYWLLSRPFLAPPSFHHGGSLMRAARSSRWKTPVSVPPDLSFFLSFRFFSISTSFPSLRFVCSLARFVNALTGSTVSGGIQRDATEKCAKNVGEGGEREGRGIVVIGISRVLVNLVSPHQQVSGEPVSRCGPCSWERRRRRTVAVVEFDLNPVEIVEGIAIDGASEWNVEIGRFRDLNRAYRDRSMDTK